MITINDHPIPKRDLGTMIAIVWQFCCKTYSGEKNLLIPFITALTNLSALLGRSPVVSSSMLPTEGKPLSIFFFILLSLLTAVFFLRF